MSDEQRGYLIAYDIADDTRRARIVKLLRRCGERLQYSVFLLRIRPAAVLRLRADLETVIDRKEDAVLICDLGRSDTAKRSMTFIGRRSYSDTVIPTVI